MKRLSKDYQITVDELNSKLENCSDFLLREIVIQNKRAFVCAMDGLVNSLQVSHMITEPILGANLEFMTPTEHFDKIKNSVVEAVEMNEIDNYEDCFYFLMSGFAVFYLDGHNKALAMGVQGWDKRSTDEPGNEAMIKGAKECFVETLNDNKALVRKRLKTHHLKFKQIKLGNSAKTPVVIAYIDNRADLKLVQSVEKRLKQANLNTVLDFGALNPFIDTDIGSFFSCVGNTERPDTLSSKLLEGRVAVMVEGTPFVMYLPYLFSDNFSSLDDYDNPPFYSTFIRLLRYFSFIVSLLLPGVYVAIGTFHQEMIPTTLLYIVALSEASTPLPLMLEAVAIHIMYEIMREAGLRLPKTIGHAVSIIGAIVIGEATVSAGIIGAPMLVVVAVTAIASYVVYPLYESVAVLRIIFIIIGGLTGIYGIIIVLGALFVNMTTLNPFGVPYTAPISPLTRCSLYDTLFSQSWKRLARRRVRVSELEGASLDK